MHTISTRTTQDGIQILTIDVPEKPMNVVTPQLREDLKAAIDKLRNDENLRGAILTSGKRDFMAGGDLKSMLGRFDFAGKTSAQHMEETEKFGIIIRSLETCGKPVVAAINGLALGGGFELSLACHRRIVADQPGLIIGLPEATLGLMPGAGGTQRVSRMLGAEKALPILQGGKTMRPDKALELGLIDELVSPEELIPAAERWILEVGEAEKPWDQKGFVPPGGGISDKRLTLLYNLEVVTQATAKHGNEPSALAILTAVARGLTLPFDAGLRAERRQFVTLMMSPVTRNIVRTQFVTKGEVEKLKRRPQGIETRSFEKITVLGGGLMGAGIAQVSAMAGMEVVILDISQKTADASIEKIRTTFKKGIERSKVKPEKAEEALARIKATTNYADIAGSDLVVEAVAENREIKNSVFQQAYDVLGSDAIYCSNTSRLPITGLSEAITRPDRFIGTHFFSPADRMALVEVIKGQATSEETLAHTLDYVKAIRKVPVIVNDGDGFFTSRLFARYLNEANAMIEDGFDPALIENGAKHAGFPVGPLALLDEVSLKVTHSAQQTYRKEQGDAWQENAIWRVRRRFVEELDRGGRRFGGGYYEYPENGGKYLWPGIRELYQQMNPQPSVEEVKKRFLYIQALEAVKAYEDGILEDIIEGDLAATLGIGYPKWTGGPFSLITTVGAAEFAQTCLRFAADYGDYWNPTPSLLEHAENNTGYYTD